MNVLQKECSFEWCTAEFCAFIFTDMENFDHELFEVDEQIRALDEYDTSNDEDDKIDIKYEDLDDDIVTFNVSEPGPPPAKVARKSSPSKSAAKHPKKLTKRRGHLDPEDVQALEEERGFRMEMRGTKGKEGGRKKKVYNYIWNTTSTNQITQHTTTSNAVK